MILWFFPTPYEDFVSFFLSHWLPHISVELGAVQMEGLIVILDLTFSLIFSFLSKFISQWRWPPLTSCAGMLKNKLRHRTLHPLFFFFFFQIYSSCFVVECWGNLGGLAKQMCFPWRRVWMEHIPGESCVNPSIGLVWNLPDPWNTLAD